MEDDGKLPKRRSSSPIASTVKPKIASISIVATVATAVFFAGRLSVHSHTGTDSGRSEPVSSRSVARGASSGSSDEPGRAGPDSKSRPKTTRPLSKEERLAKLESILRNEDPMARNRAFTEYLNQLDSAGIKEAIESIAALGMNFDRWGEYSMLLSAWSNQDPLGAIAYAQANGGGWGYDTNIILTAWAMNDPDAALRWAEANHKGEGGNPHLAGVIKAIAATDSVRATTLLIGMTAGEQRGEALDAILPHILSKGDVAAREWVASIQDERLRNGAMDRMAKQLAIKDPKGTAEWLLASSGDAAQRGMDDVMSAWMGKDQQAASAYYQSLPPGEVRSSALGGMVGKLAEKNPREAADYIDQNPSDVDDRVIQQFTWNAFQSDPGLATSYISKVANPEERDRTYRRSIDYWMQTDATAATTWLKNNPLPDTLNGYVEGKLAN